MELWIRSQNKDRIVKPNAVMVASFQELVSIHCYIDKDTNVWLGNYSTKERALEVLDEIHQRLINLGTIEIAPDSYKVLPKDTSNVYEMPKE